MFRWSISASVGALERNGENAAALLEDRGLAILTEAHKGLDGSQSRVSGTGSVASLRLELFEEIHDERGVELLELQRGGLHVEAFARIEEEELEGVCVTLTGVLTGTALPGKALAQERRDMGGDRRHDGSPQTKSSQRAAMSVISCGVLSKYQ